MEEPESGSHWVDMSARIDGKKPKSLRRIVTVVTLVGHPSMRYVEVVGKWCYETETSMTPLDPKMRRSTVQLAHWYRRMERLSPDIEYCG
jgi:hypothetical protein